MKDSSLLNQKILDKGFLRLVDFIGGDLGVVRSARVSFGKDVKDEHRDKKLISYLLKHQHLTPFEHSVFKFHVSCPIFVMRQWIRHRWSSTNEKSARYSQMTDEFYVPKEFRIQDIVNKQGSLKDSKKINQRKALSIYKKSIDTSFKAYKDLINMGVAREMARMALPVSLYTQFYWTINSRSLMNFMFLRAEEHAQWEIREYAIAIAKLFKMKMPWTHEAFLRHVWKGGNAELDRQKDALESV
ncbi:FAD-dependent thymidylate synthase [Elusimicrobiota bacterium]